MPSRHCALGLLLRVPPSRALHSHLPGLHSWSRAGRARRATSSPSGCIDCDLHPSPHGFSLFLEYLFSKGNMQLELETCLQISPVQTGLFEGTEGFIISVFSRQPPFPAMSFGFGGGVSLGLLTSNFCFLLTFLFSACFPLPTNPLHKPLPSGGLAQWALGVREGADSGLPSAISFPPLEGSGRWDSGASRRGSRWGLPPSQP